MPATFELECSEPSGSIDVDAFEFETLDELAEELRERAPSCNDSLVVDFEAFARHAHDKLAPVSR
jgi:hypothetical protein